MTSATMRRPREALVAVASGGTPRVYRPGCGPLPAPIRVRPVPLMPVHPTTKAREKGTQKRGAVLWSGRVRVIQVVVQPDSSRHTYVWPALGGGCASRGGVMAPRRTRSGGGSGVVVGRSGVLVGKGQGDPGGGSA